MPKANAQTTRRSDVEEALLRAAAELIAEVGWGKVSSRMVAERAGVNNALVHYHFGSMDELLRGAAERVLIRAFEAPTRAVWRGGDVVGGMMQALRWLDQLDVDGVETMVLVESLVRARRDPDLRSHVTGALDELRKELTEVIANSDQLRAAGPEGVATLLLALLDGLLLHRLVDSSLEFDEARQSLEILLGGVREKGAMP